MSPERLASLQRQRELVAQHLAWLDLELASAKAAAPLAVSTGPTEVAAPAPDAAPPQPAGTADEERLAAANARANAILEEYSVTERFNPDNTRRGCLLFAIAVLLLGFAGVLLIYILRYR